MRRIRGDQDANDEVEGDSVRDECGAEGIGQGGDEYTSDVHARLATILGHDTRCTTLDQVSSEVVNK